MTMLPQKSGATTMERHQVDEEMTLGRMTEQPNNLDR